eukprot:TRINITY_DN110736_c0_g1_i1.p1 TRINITY_DN110736_c0_g1~~TRINITY_DN110736_c0_g1_i1.p1  ORF type:complete len:230 (-),score=31.03 TRINITY_DN110736_c0_g1_i1:133-822(-)
MISAVTAVLLVISLLLVSLIIYLAFVFATGCGPRCLKSLLSRCIRRFKKRKKWNYTKLDEGLYLGSLPREESHLEDLKKEGVQAVVTLNESWELLVSPQQVQDAGFSCLHIPTPDFFAPTQTAIAEAVAFIKGHRDAGRSVYVHCNAGRGRSAVCILCYLISSREMCAEDAFVLVKSQRNIANMTAMGGRFHKQWAAVKRFERTLRCGGSKVDHGTKVVPIDEAEFGCS